MSAVGPADRRQVLRGAAATAGAVATGITSLTLPSATAAASPAFTTGLGDADLQLYVDATAAESWSGTGLWWRDLTDNGRDLPVGGEGQPSHATADLGITGGTGAFVFDADSDGDGVTPEDGLNGRPFFAYGAAWSIAAWVRFDSLLGWQTIVGQGDAGDDALYFQKVEDGLSPDPDTSQDQGVERRRDQLGVVLERGAGHRLYCYAATAAVVDTWYHLVGTATADHVRIYVDGELERTVATDPTYGGGLKHTDPAVNWTVGSAYSGRTIDPLRGALGFVQIWTRALTAGEVAAQYAATRGPYHPA